jgi:hypothetical protein
MQPLNPSNQPGKTNSGRLFTKKMVFTVGLVSIAVGFMMIRFVDPYGQNWAGIVSPFLIIGGYVSIVIALLLKAENTTETK